MDAFDQMTDCLFDDLDQLNWLICTPRDLGDVRNRFTAFGLWVLLVLVVFLIVDTEAFWIYLC